MSRKCHFFYLVCLRKYQRKKMKRIKTVLLSAITLFVLTACGDEDNSTNPNNENNTSQVAQDSNSNEDNSNQGTENNNVNTESNTSQNDIENNPEPYVAPTEFSEALIVGKNFYEAEDENEDGIFTLNEWLQITFVSNTQLSSARNGQQYPKTNYHLEEGKLFFSVKEDGETHIDIISITSASQSELNVSTSDGDSPIWIFEVALKKEMIVGKTFKFQSNALDYTLKFDSNQTLTLSNPTQEVSVGTYEVKNGILNSTLENKTTTKRVMQINGKGDLLLWDTNSLKATWYRVIKS